MRRKREATLQRRPINKSVELVRIGITMGSNILVYATTMFITMALITQIYLEIYRKPQRRAVTRILRRYYAGAEREDADSERSRRDTVARRDRMKLLRDRMDVSLDALPVVRFDAARSEDAIGEEESRVRARRHECLTSGYFLREEDDYVDCRIVCGVSDGVEYRYYDKLGIMLNGRRGRVGAYCVPTDAATCNPNTYLVLYTKHGWRCVPQTRAFAGEGGNRIIACDGTLLDRATGRVWRDHVDPTLTFQSIDEKLSGTDEFRFVCEPDVKDAIGNEMIPASIDRLLLLRNVCAMLVPYADTSRMYPDFASGECRCESSVSELDVDSGVCLPFGRDDDGTPFRSDTLESRTKGVAPCLQNWSTTSDMDLVSIRNGTSTTLMPCGVERDRDGTPVAASSTSLPACDKTYVRLYDRAVPSPDMMLEASQTIRDLKRL